MCGIMFQVVQTMCGICGYFCRKQVSMQKVLDLLQKLEMHKYQNLDEKRPVGGHGAGVCFLDNTGKLIVHKVGMTNASPVKDLCEIREVTQVKSRIVIGHVRRASDFLMETVKYMEAQPYKSNCLGVSEIVSTHNGHVENYKEIRENLSDKHSFQTGTEKVKLNDSEVIPHLFEENLMMYSDEFEARKRTYERITGRNTIALVTLVEGNGQLHILHKGSTRGMHIWKNDKGEILLCSRKEPLQQVFGDSLEEKGFKKILSIEWKDPRKVQQTYRIGSF